MPSVNFSPNNGLTSTQTTMTKPMTGSDYLQSLRDGREVWIYGDRVHDVTTHPAFRNSTRMVARLYDAMHRPENRGLLTSPTDTGSEGYTHPFFKASHTVEELVAARDAIAAWQRIGYGWMGRSPDFMAALLGMLGPNADLYDPYQENARRWYRKGQEEIPYLNHAMANPPIDRRLSPDQVADVYIRVVKETGAGLIVSGAKNITTNAALTHYSFVGHDGGAPVRDKSFAVAFMLPMNSPGVKIICRPSYEMTAGVMGSPFDYPLSSRFDENDAIFILDQVLVPWENVLIYGDLHKYNHHSQRTGLYQRSGLQACTRLAVKLDLLAGLLMKATESTGVDQFRGVQVSMGEVMTWRHLFWGLSDAMARTVEPQNGAMLPSMEYMMAYRMMMGMAYPRVKEIISQLAASGLIYQPSSARDFQSPELRPYLDTYVRGSNGDSVERIKLMKLLWDAIGTEFGGRHELYERNHSGNHEAIRLHALFQGITEGTVDEVKAFADDCMSEYDLDGWTAPDLINPQDISFFHTQSYQEVKQSVVQPIIHPNQGNGRFSQNGHSTADTEWHKMIVEWNRTAVDYGDNRCLHHPIEIQTERTPDAIAIKIDGESSILTYQELNDRANQLAHYLLSLGVEPETLVAICMERSLEMVVSVLAVLKAGGAYLPLDPGYPQERLRFMLTDSQAAILLTQERLKDLFQQDSLTSQSQTCCVDTEWSKLAEQPTRNPTSSVQLHHLAYVIYTSGSTGKPKGVMIEHQAIGNRIRWLQERYPLTAKDKVLQKTPFSFDASVWELILPLQVGAQLVLAKPDGHKDSGYLAKAIQRHQITILQGVPTMYQMLVERPEFAYCTTLRRLFSAGEALSIDLVKRVFKVLNRHDVELINTYGPTEASIDVSSWPCVQGAPHQIAPIGKPIANTKLYILDEALQPVPLGASGELHIAGVGLARGYLNRPELTAERFITNPFVTEEPYSRLYKTGDLARYLPDGTIAFMGRIDHQIKLRGFRIELGEIEASLNQHPTIKQALVSVHEKLDGDKQLIAYIIPANDNGRSAEGERYGHSAVLRNFLQTKLPEYMIPNRFILLKSLPLTPNGKVDRNALPAPDFPVHRHNGADDHSQPTSEIEQTIGQIWQGVLNIETVGVFDHFFDLGGNSLLAARVHRQLEQQIPHFNLSMTELFQYPTVRSLSSHLSQLQESTVGFNGSHERATRRKARTKQGRQQRRQVRDKL